MGDGLATSTQLAAFREQYKTFGMCHSIWMSATLDRQWLQTVDFMPCIETLTALGLSEADHTAPILAKRLNAVKKVAPAPMDCRTSEGLADHARENIALPGHHR
jgi:CRISPR-associated endonuclease/helicase Cas3